MDNSGNLLQMNIKQGNKLSNKTLKEKEETKTS